MAGGEGEAGCIGFHGVPDTNSLQRLGPGPRARRGPRSGADPHLSATNKHPGPSSDACRACGRSFFFFSSPFFNEAAKWAASWEFANSSLSGAQ